MKRFLIYIALFFAIVCIVDLIFGKAVDRLCSTAKDGEKSKIYYIANRMNEDVVIMGSSRAYRHYNPIILEDSLNLRVFNAGCSKMGIVCNYGLYKAFISQHKPQIIIYEVFQTDFYKDDNSTYLDNLRLLRNNNNVRDYISSISPDDKWKMLSSLYSYNTKWIYILQESLKASESLEKGYAPNRGRLSYKPKKLPDNFTVDSLKLTLFRDFLKDVNDDGIQIVLTVSPFYYDVDYRWIGWAKALAKEYQVLFYDFSTDVFFHENSELFFDQIHLNEKGSTVYTKLIAHKLKSQIY